MVVTFLIQHSGFKFDDFDTWKKGTSNFHDLDRTRARAPLENFL